MSLSEKEISSLLYKHYLGAGSTRTSREFFEEAIKSSFIVRPDMLWTYSDFIPDGTDKTGGAKALKEIQELQNEEIFYHIVNEEPQPLIKRWIDFPLKMVDAGTDSSFVIADDSGNLVRNIVPFNYFEGYYNYELKTDTGKKIAFGVGDWVVDTYSGIVTFYGKLPAGVDHNHPPTLSFYQYVGGNGFRQDTYGYDGAILPLDSIEVNSGDVVLNRGSKNRTLSQHIIDKANEITPSFVKTFGWDGSDTNEGIALSFEKIVPLTYTSTLDVVKGYDKASNAEIGTLLSSKKAKLESPSSNYEILFVSQKAEANSAYRIVIDGTSAVGSDLRVNQDTVSLTGNSWNVYKIWITDKAFAIVRVLNNVSETLTFTVIDNVDDVSALLVYWSNEDKQYQPFRLNEDALCSFGFPVVTVNGRLPPSVALGTASLATFSDSITPDYYGPRLYTITLASENTLDGKSADYTVREKEGLRLDEILSTIHNKVNNFQGIIYFREGSYSTSSDIIFSDWGNTGLKGESQATTIDFKGHTLKVEVKANEVFELSRLKIQNASTVHVVTQGSVVISDISAVGAKLKLYVGKNATVTVRNVSFDSLEIQGEDSETVSVDIRGSVFSDVSINKNEVVFKDNICNSILTADKRMYLISNTVNILRSKYPDVFIRGNLIYRCEGISGEGANEVPAGTDENYIVKVSNNTEVKTTGRLPIFSKDDSAHMKYAELASPLYFNREKNVIELIYDPDVFSIIDNKLSTEIKSAHLHMSNIEFEKHENSGLAPKAFTTKQDLNDAFRDVYKWKADLDESGKIPLGELPDSVAYGGLLYVGNWSFNKNEGKYPSFKDALYKQDPNAPGAISSLQKGWFFIVEEAIDENDDGLDNPVAEQITTDGVKFTAGDWIVYVGTGNDDSSNSDASWQKIDRAYSDPSFSPLPYYAKVPGAENIDWSWKRNNKGGMLDLSNKTIVEAFKQINDLLLKLSPDRPAAINEIKLQPDNSNNLLKFRKISGGSYTQVETALDGTSSQEIVIKPENDQLIFFGDEATLVADIDDERFEIQLQANGEAITEGPVKVSAPEDVMKGQKWGRGIWNGVHVSVHNPDVQNGKSHTVRLSIDNAKVKYNDKERVLPQYCGNSSTCTYFTSVAYFPDKIERVEDSYVGIAEAKLGDKIIAGACSGVRKIDLSTLDEIPGFNITLKDVVSNSIVPAEKFITLTLLINDNPELVLCKDFVLDPYVQLENSTSGYQNVVLEDVNIPVTPDNRALVLDEDQTLDFYITVYDLYGEPHSSKVYSYSGIRFDPTNEKERVTSGQISEDSTYRDFASSFGKKFDSSIKPTEELFKIGELVDGKLMSFYQQPMKPYNNWDYSKWTGQNFAGDQYGVACIDIGHIKNAAGFTFEITDFNGKVNSYTGSTEDTLIQICLVDTNAKNTEDQKVTSFLDANRSYDGISKIDEKQFGEAVMYAGGSTASVKRVTFGRGKILSGEVYVRIGIKKDSGLKFTGIKLLEVI